MDLGKIFKTVAPWLGSVIGGPFGAAAGKIVGDIVGTDGENPDKMAEAIAKATPEQLLALKEADHNFALQMQQLGFKNVADLERISADDRASARAREVAVKDSTPRILAYVYSGGFFLTLAAFIWIMMSAVKVDPVIMGAIQILLGVETGMVLGSKEYYFGSSSGSKEKDATIKSFSSDTPAAKSN